MPWVISYAWFHDITQLSVAIFHFVKSHKAVKPLWVGNDLCMEITSLLPESAAGWLLPISAVCEGWIYKAINPNLHLFMSLAEYKVEHPKRKVSLLWLQNLMCLELTVAMYALILYTSVGRHYNCIYLFH